MNSRSPYTLIGGKFFKKQKIIISIDHMVNNHLKNTSVQLLQICN